MKRNVLPPGYKSWLKFLVDNRGNFNQRQESFFDPYPRPPISEEEAIMYRAIEFDLDFVKARAMDEILKYLLTDKEASACIYDMHVTLGMMGGGKAYEDDAGLKLMRKILDLMC